MHHPLSQSLCELGLRGIARALDRSLTEPSTTQLSFEESQSLLIDVEAIERANHRYDRRLRWAKL